MILVLNIFVFLIEYLKKVIEEYWEVYNSVCVFRILEDWF